MPVEGRSRQCRKIFVCSDALPQFGWGEHTTNTKGHHRIVPREACAPDARDCSGACGRAQHPMRFQKQFKASRALQGKHRGWDKAVATGETQTRLTGRTDSCPPC